MIHQGGAGAAILESGAPRGSGPLLRAEFAGFFVRAVWGRLRGTLALLCSLPDMTAILVLGRVFTSSHRDKTKTPIVHLFSLV